MIDEWPASGKLEQVVMIAPQVIGTWRGSFVRVEKTLRLAVVTSNN